MARRHRRQPHPRQVGDPVSFLSIVKKPTPSTDTLSVEDAREVKRRVGIVMAERDGATGAAMHWENEARQAAKEADTAAAERDEALDQRDTLADYLTNTALPLFGGPVTPTKNPVDALLYEEQVKAQDFRPHTPAEAAEVEES